MVCLIEFNILCPWSMTACQKIAKSLPFIGASLEANKQAFLWDSFLLGVPHAVARIAHVAYCRVSTGRRWVGFHASKLILTLGKEIKERHEVCRCMAILLVQTKNHKSSWCELLGFFSSWFLAVMSLLFFSCNYIPHTVCIHVCMYPVSLITGGPIWMKFCTHFISDTAIILLHILFMQNQCSILCLSLFHVWHQMYVVRVRGVRSVPYMPQAW